MYVRNDGYVGVLLDTQTTNTNTDTDIRDLPVVVVVGMVKECTTIDVDTTRSSTAIIKYRCSRGMIEVVP